jgi:hypothetical protein
MFATGRSSAMSSGAATQNNLPSEKVLKAWKEMLVFMQEFVENNFGKAALRRVVREPTYYEKLTNSGRCPALLRCGSNLNHKAYRHCLFAYCTRVLRDFVLRAFTD